MEMWPGATGGVGGGWTGGTLIRGEGRVSFRGVRAGKAREKLKLCCLHLNE